jgi:spermidine synthase/tetratricopeptide (TPR) repeat protein
MVAAFIFGITLGSFLISFKRTDRGYYPLLGWLELAIGLTLLLSLPLYMWLPYTLNQLQGLLQRTPEAFPLYQLIKFSLCFAVMVPPTVFIGMTLPAASKIATRGLGTLGSQVGSVFAINTAGTLIGAVLGGAILMPWLGLRDTLLVGIVTNLALGFLILATAPGGLLGRREKSQETTAPNQPSAVPTDNVETSNVPIKSVDYSEIENIRTPEGVAVSESSVPGITDARDEYIGIQTPTGFPVSDSGEDYVSIQTPTGVPLSETSQLDVSHLDADGFAPGQNPIHGSGNFYIEPRRPLLLLGTLALLFTGTLAFVQTWDDRILMRSVFRMRETFESYEDYKAFTHRGEILAYKDGIDASIAVVKAGENYHSLYINGKPDATVHGTRETGFYSDMPTQLLIGHLGKLIHPDARDVLVVGQGSGVSAGAIAAYPDTNVELIELSREIVKFAKYFDWGNRNLHERENVTLINEDARTYLILSDKKYDLIVNQPSNPWVAGNASLFSLEFFEESKKHLTDDGLFLQWVQHYETTNDAMLLILRTFEEVFPYYTVWEMSRSDLALVGSSKPFTFDVETLVRGMQQPHVQEDLRAIGMSIPEILLSSLMIDSSHAPAHFGGFGSLNSEFHPILEYTAPLGFFLNKLPTYTEKLDLRRGAFQVTPLPWQTYQRGEDVPVTPSEIWQQAYLRSIPRSSVFKQQPQYILDRWEAADPENPWIEIYRADDVAEEGAREQLAIIDAALESDESLLEDPEFRTRLMVALNDAFANTKQNPARGRPYLERILQVLEYELATDPDDAWQLHRGRGLTYAWMQDYDKAVAELETALELGQAGYGAVGFWREDEVELYEFLALATVSAQQFDKTDRYLDLMGRETPAAAAVLGRLQLAQSRKK